MNDTTALLAAAEANLKTDFEAVDSIALFNQEKVLNAFIDNRVSQMHFTQTTGYGYADTGRDVLGKLYAEVFEAEAGLVSPHILSGTHAITLSLFAVLRPGDCVLSVTGKPYDTLDSVISKPDSGSLADFGISFVNLDYRSGKFDFEEIARAVQEYKPKMLYIQRSKGYEARFSLSVAEIAEICAFIKKLDEKTVIFVDNCYGEFTETEEPSKYADLCAGSLIKNPGGGIAHNGGYIVGKAGLIELCANRLTTPATGGEIGSFSGGYLSFYQGLFLAPHVTAQALKGALLISETLSALGYRVVPGRRGKCYEVVCSVEFGAPEPLISFCRNIQLASPVDSYVTPYPWEMPGYNDQVIMAAGCFIQGSSIELSCDAPIRAPYIGYIQGGLTYEHVKIALKRCVDALKTDTKNKL